MTATWNEKLANVIVSKALTFLGQGEDPPGSNRGKIPDACFRLVHGSDANPADYTTADREWCAEFVCAVLASVGISPRPNTASTGELYSWGKMHNCTLLQPRMGDIACALDGRSPTGFRHALIVEHNFGDGMIHCISGNEGDKVARSVRPIDTMKYFRPYLPAPKGAK